MHAAIQSTRGVQHELPIVSDDVVVGVIMVLFLLLFAFGTVCAIVSLAYSSLLPHRSLAQGSNKANCSAAHANSKNLVVVYLPLG